MANQHPQKVAEKLVKRNNNNNNNRNGNGNGNGNGQRRTMPMNSARDRMVAKKTAKATNGEP